MGGVGVARASACVLLPGGSLGALSLPSVSLGLLGDLCYVGGTQSILKALLGRRPPDPCLHFIRLQILARLHFVGSCLEVFAKGKPLQHRHGLCSTKGRMLDTADPMAAKYAQGITRDQNLGTNDAKMH